MRGTVFSQLRLGVKSLLRDRRGNAFMLTAAAIVPVIGIVGSAVDIGRGYMAQLRLQQACDAGVLAGRRAMAAGQYNAAAIAQANKMFAANFSAGIYGTTASSFTSQPLGVTDVSGAATATLPTAMMYIFGKDAFNLSASCAAKLEIANTDVMLVLDVTGSMETNTELLDEDGDGKPDDADGDGKPDPAVKRIEALKSAAMVFFDTLTTADKGTGRLRFGIVPYSSAVNVGKVLQEKDPSWLSNHMLLPSRTPIMKLTWSGGTVPNGATTGTTATTAWEDLFPISGFASSNACSGLTVPADSRATSSATINANKGAYFVDKDDVRRVVDDAGTKHSYYNYRYNWDSANSKCVLQRRTVSFTHTAVTKPTAAFRTRYRYEDRVFDVSATKSSPYSLTADTGDSGVDSTYTWAGCVSERRTTPFDATTTAPGTALDMDIDSKPTSAEETKWQLLIPEVAFPRSRAVGNKPSFTVPSQLSPSGILAVDKQAITVDSAYVTAETSEGGSWQNYSRYWKSGWGVCPAPVMKLTTMTTTDRPTFKSNIDALQSVGGTYHDSGMVWGIRLISPRGLFADENAQDAPGTNGRPISRHIIFMTDGAMAANMGNLGAQGYEHLMQRVGGSIDTSDADLTLRHNNRFTQLCAKAKDKDHNITIWVIGFGTALNPSLMSCSSQGKAYQTGSAKRLEQIFQSIAGQISRLRLSQ